MRFVTLIALLLAGCGESPTPTSSKPDSTQTTSDAEMDDLDKLESSLATDVPTIVAVAQTKYRTYYQICIQANRDRDSFTTELLLLVNDGPEPIPEKYRLWRPDAIWKENNNAQPTQFELDPASDFAPLTETHASGVKLTVHPFVWNACEFRFDSNESSWDAVDRWHAKWIDENDNKPRDTHGLAGVIHWLHQPVREGSHVKLLVDFGSAPTDAFHELIAALRDSGVDEVTVASFDYSEKSDTRGTKGHDGAKGDGGYFPNSCGELCDAPKSPDA